MIKYKRGDLFSHIKDETGEILIPHVVNNKGAWGAGFVVPLGKHFPKAQESYLKWFSNRNAEVDFRKENGFLLGNVDFVKVGNVTIANMLAQTLGGPRPLHYNWLVKCMEKVTIRARCTGTVIHTPQFGAGLAGGNWEFIHELIEDCWDKRGIDTVVYHFGRN